MVKLLRLKGDTNQGTASLTEIRNTFSEPIFVKANSRIALAGLDVAFRDAVNEQFQVSKVISGLTLTMNGQLLTFPAGTYSQTELIAELNAQARLLAVVKATAFEGSHIICEADGRLFKVTKSNYSLDVAEFDDDTYWIVLDGSPTLAQETYTGDAGSEDEALSADPVPNASCHFRATINSTDEIKFGVVGEGGNFAWGLEINAAGDYITKFNNADSVTGVAASATDKVTMVRLGDQVTIIVEDGGGEIVNVVNTLTSEIWGPYLSEGPFWYVTTPVGSAGSIDDVNLNVVDAGSEVANGNSLLFNDQKMALYFGYPTLGPFEILGATPAVLTSPQYMQGERTFRGLMVNIDPFQLESYDGAPDSKSRPNCLYIIHDLDHLGNDVNLDVPELIKLDLKNSADFTLNQLRVTFRTSLDNKALEFSNNPIVTLLIFGPDE